MKMKICVANEIRTSQFSLACVRDSEKSKGDSTHAVRAIVCDSEKSSFNFVCKADLSVR